MTVRPKGRKSASKKNRTAVKARNDLYAAESALARTEPVAAQQDEALSKLLRVIEQINAELDVTRVLKIAAQQIIEIFAAERVFIVDARPQERLAIRLAVTFKGRPVEKPEYEVSHALVREVARRRAPILVDDATADPRFAQVSSIRNMQLHSVMAAPLLAAGELLGVVYADNRMLRGAFNPHTLNLLGVFANHVGIALRNAQLFRTLNETRAELALAERLKTLGEVATFVVHDVKNPLASIQILMDSLKDGWKNPKIRDKAFDIIPQEVARLKNAVNQILDYSRPTHLQKVPLDLAKLLQSSLRALDPEIQRESVQVARQFEIGTPPALADGERIRDVFVNIFRNALDAMVGRPKKKLRLSVARLDESRAEVTIEDNGPGIPEEALATIFEPFRSYNKPFGTGIGLALAQKVMREHGGRILADNVASGGARFRLQFPITGT